jgi:hypothetical protein
MREEGDTKTQNSQKLAQFRTVRVQVVEPTFLCLHLFDSKGHSPSLSLGCPPSQRLELHIWLPNDPLEGKAKPGDPIVGKRVQEAENGVGKGVTGLLPSTGIDSEPSLGRRGAGAALCSPPVLLGTMCFSLGCH